MLRQLIKIKIIIPRNINDLQKKKIEEIKKRISTEYLKRIEGERPAEKWIQGKLIIDEPNYIDSEFQFNRNQKIGKLRILLSMFSFVLSINPITLNLLGFSEAKALATEIAFTSRP